MVSSLVGDFGTRYLLDWYLIGRDFLAWDLKVRDSLSCKLSIWVDIVQRVKKMLDYCQIFMLQFELINSDSKFGPRTGFSAACFACSKITQNLSHA